ncbi:RidA family protein [Isosphaeraceae bacterium EP7]
MSHEDIQAIRVPGAPVGPLPYSPAIRAGDFVFVSGQASTVDNEIVHDTFENEARRTYENIGKILAAAGLDFSRVVQVRCYLNSKADWDAHNRIFREYFAEPYPARTSLVGCLADFVKYEVDVVAYAGRSKEA